ncbi:MAG: gfo/Idh/MocA family oxidoreductase [Spirochaetaceae bacterium]|nr:MAG: gfo/Idh/MocA family oxidoreductase [Spirochaetaceae bacterium]
MGRKLSCVIVGAGHRAVAYASYALTNPDELEVVAVADPSPLRRELAAKRFGLPPERCFESAEALAAGPMLADFAINGTMDHQHVPTSLPLLDRGYDLLLEKPFATNESELWTLVESARRNGRRIAICHVLRHAPFYEAIRSRVAGGLIGDILNVQAVEHVSYHHMGIGFIRGKWSRTDYCRSTMLMSKSCHDLDLLAWMKSGVAPVRVSSFGSNFQFRSERAPAGAGTRCVVDCPIESDCLYSARKHYLDHPKRWAFYVWDSLEHIDEPTDEDRLESLRTSPYGRCVWKTDMNVVDHQSVVVEFADGCTATLNMIGGAAKPSRSIHLVGTHGEIQGNLEDSRFAVRHIDPRPGHEYSQEIVDLNVGGDMTGARGGHGGGDERLVADFLRYLNGESPSLSSTTLDDSIAGHLIGFSANRSLDEGRTVDIDLRAPRGVG